MAQVTSVAPYVLDGKLVLSICVDGYFERLAFTPHQSTLLLEVLSRHIGKTIRGEI